MAKYRCQFKIPVWVNINVEAESEEEAWDKAWNEGPSLNSYAGNGGTDKLIGVYGNNISVEASNNGVEQDGIREVK